MPVPQPVIYAASSIAQNDPLMRNRNAKGKVEPTGTVDPLRAFEIDARQMYPELQQWMTFPEADRIRRVDTIARRPTAHRDLNYVIWRETMPDGPGGKPVGSVEVSARAIRRLLGLADPPVPKVEKV